MPSDSPLKDNTIYLTKHGSQAYGTNTSESDLDIKGVMIPPKEYYFGFTKHVEQIEESEPDDLVIYEIRKFFRLAADCNPNIIEVLHTDESDILFIDKFGRKLRDAANKFLSQKAKHTFSGYAHSQLKRIKGHYRWLKDPPGDPRNLENRHVSDNMIIEWKQYQTWRKNRNPKRAALEEKHGYDTKHAMHLVRLLRMGEEILKTGKVHVRRPDREELLAIRNHGIWKYDDLIEWAEKKDEELTEFYESGKSPLPHSPPREELDKLCVELVEEYLE